MSSFYNPASPSTTNWTYVASPSPMPTATVCHNTSPSSSSSSTTQQLNGNNKNGFWTSYSAATGVQLPWKPMTSTTTYTMPTTTASYTAMPSPIEVKDDSYGGPGNLNLEPDNWDLNGGKPEGWTLKEPMMADVRATGKKQKFRVKHKTAGCCGGCNCTGCYDYPGGCCGSCNCEGCCDREQYIVRKFSTDSLAPSWAVKKVTEKKKARNRGCCC